MAINVSKCTVYGWVSPRYYYFDPLLLSSGNLIKRHGRFSYNVPTYVLTIFPPEWVDAQKKVGSDFYFYLFTPSYAIGSAAPSLKKNLNASNIRMYCIAYTEQGDNHGTMILHEVCYSAYTLR